MFLDFCDDNSGDNKKKKNNYKKNNKKTPCNKDDNVEEEEDGIGWSWWLRLWWGSQWWFGHLGLSFRSSTKVLSELTSAATKGFKSGFLMRLSRGPHHFLYGTTMQRCNFASFHGPRWPFWGKRWSWRAMDGNGPESLPKTFWKS